MSLYDGAWMALSYDISSTADNQATVYVRWGMGTTDNVYTYCGWNVDDVSFTAFPICYGDLDGDGDTDQADLGILLADWGCYDPVNGCACDLNGDDQTDESDLGLLLANWGCAP
jgi:hypothetical protein